MQESVRDLFARGVVGLGAGDSPRASKSGKEEEKQSSSVGVSSGEGSPPKLKCVKIGSNAI